jgi:general secretion pathway protein D
MFSIIRKSLIVLAALSVSFSKNNNVLNTFSVKDAEITTVAKLLANLSGKGLVITPPIRGKITIILKHPATIEELWDIFSSAIVPMGYTVKKEGNVIKLMPTSKAFYLFSLNNKTKEPLGEYTTTVIELKYNSAEKVAQLLRSILSPRSRILTDKSENIIIISDFYQNIKTAEKIVSLLDKPNSQLSIKIFKLKHIPVNNFIKLLNPYAEYARVRLGVPFLYSYDEDTNTLTILSTKEVLNSIENLKKELDKSSILGKERKFYIIPLKFASVDDIFSSLSSLFKETTSEKSVKGFSSLSLANGIKIGFDKASNSILAYATEKEYQQLKNFISKLDQRKKQVLIMATIIEASDKSILDSGIKWQILGTYGGVAFGGASKNDIYSAYASGKFVIGTLTKSGETVSIGGSELFFPDLLFLYSLLEQGTGFNVISNPKILTLDNKEADIKVGQVVPFPTGIKYDVNGNPIITYDYKEIGLELKVTPRISKKSLRLMLTLKVQEITGYLTNNVGGINYSVPITSTRELNSDIVVQSGQTVIIGGLISNKALFSNSKVPVLGDIPMVGNLFKYKHKEQEKTNLFIFITPYVISSPEELAKIMEEHKKLAQKLLKLIKKPTTKKVSSSQTSQTSQTTTTEGYIKVEENQENSLPY